MSSLLNSAIFSVSACVNISNLGSITTQFAAGWSRG